jgi:hypothetical protein
MIVIILVIEPTYPSAHELSFRFRTGQHTVRANFFEAFDPEFTEGLRKQKAGSFKQITLMDCL